VFTSVFCVCAPLHVVPADLIRAGQLLKIELLDHIIMCMATVDRPGHQSLRALAAILV
jgi:hypothetical protein